MVQTKILQPIEQYQVKGNWKKKTVDHQLGESALWW